MIYESIMGYRGSKSVALNATVKEQRVDGSRCVKTRHLRCTLMGFERNYQVKIPSKQIINKRLYSSVVERSLNNKYSLNPWFITGFIDVFFFQSFKFYRPNYYINRLGLFTDLTKKYSSITYIRYTQFSTVSASAKKKENQARKSKLDKTACTVLVIWGSNLKSSVGSGRITKVERNMIKLAPFQRSVIIGLLLSDGWITFSSKQNLNARLGFKQSLVQSTYVFHVFNLLSHYCSNVPHLTTSTRAGKELNGVEFFTRALPCFTELHSLFYPQGTKIIPDNIYDLLTPVSLAHWIMGDGTARPHGLILCTDSYSIVDVVKLMNVLIIKYRVECTIRVHRENQYRIYIREESMPLIRQIVKPHFYPSMLYKLNL